jgi:uncharacterized protein (TIGR02246 family)
MARGRILQRITSWSRRMTRLTLALVLGLSATSVSSPLRDARRQPTSAAIDADVWAPVAASVVNSDIVAMGRVYHPDAVLVSTAGTRTIRSALDGWGKDMVTAKASGTRATVEFRFTKRQDNAETAFETGVFKYTVIDKQGKESPSYRQLETLLVKHQGKWRIIMERQLEAVTQATWDALPR